MTGPIELELDGLRYVVREDRLGVWILWYKDHIIQFLTKMEVQLMLAAYRKGLLALQ